MKCEIGANSNPCENKAEFQAVNPDNNALYKICKKHTELFSSNYVVTKL